MREREPQSLHAYVQPRGRATGRPLPLVALSLALLLAASALGDTIRLKDGQIIRGQIVSFRDQQFTVLIGSGARGRRSRVTVYMEDVESIEFDSAGNSSAANDNY